ncbi:MAG: hypothetical protein AAF597_05890, partial [Bacteroidota bacterium]
MLRTLLYLSLLLSVPLASQSDQTDKALSLGYGSIGLSLSRMEPEENGRHQQGGFFIAGEIEFRRNKHWGWVGGLLLEQLKSRRNSAAASQDPMPFDMIHPYRSSLSTLHLFGGVQYNIRVLGGDLSLGVRAGPGLSYYQRTYDVFLPTGIEGGPTSGSWGTDLLGESSSATWRIRAAARLQYT